MARAKSIVLTPAEKRSAVADLKKQLKAAEAAGKSIAKDRNSKIKTHEKTLKDFDKAAAANDKVVAGFKAQLDKLAA